MGNTKIEWAEKVWNPVTGCTKVSAGCAHCYAERMAKRLAGRAGYPAKQPFKVTLRPDRLTEPLHWSKPSRVFVCSMGDLFHSDVPDEFIYEVFSTMARSQRHEFLVLTKRPRWMGEFCQRIRFIPVEDLRHLKEPGVSYWPNDPRQYTPRALPNVWLGTSVEDQATADERIPLLLQTPAAVRFVSYEPALGPINLSATPPPPGWTQLNGATLDDLRGCLPKWQTYPMRAKLFQGIDLVIAGGESGPRARPAHPQWFRSVRDQCQAEGVPFFMKQITDKGHKVPIEEWPPDLRVREWPHA